MSVYPCQLLRVVSSEITNELHSFVYAFGNLRINTHIENAHIATSPVVLAPEPTRQSIAYPIHLGLHRNPFPAEAQRAIAFPYRWHSHLHAAVACMCAINILQLLLCICLYTLCMCLRTKRDQSPRVFVRRTTAF